MKKVLFCLLTLQSLTAVAEQPLSDADRCLLEKLKQANGHTLVSQIKAQCLAEDAEIKARSGALSSRLLEERKSAYDPYVITPHKMNYILPITFTDSLAIAPYQQVDEWADHITDIEAKFQLSIKVPLNYDDIFIDGDALLFGMTLESWWQVYADNISKPFRETNYQPEIFYVAPLDWHPFGSNVGFLVGVEHQSNGRSQILSRSWNRIYSGLIMETDNWVFAFKPWIRLPEKAKQDPLDPTGDDNPDILDYMGHFELISAYKLDQLEYFFEARQNFATHKGSIKIGTTFPLWGRLKGYVEYFSGYGNSLIEYDHKQQRIGVGIALTDVL